MRWASLLPLLLAGAATAQEAPVALPSGRVVTPLEVIADESQAVYRFRFVDPGLTGPDDFDAAEDDMGYLCESYALPRVPETDAQIVITLADRAVPFGQMDPDVVQFFEAYHPEGDTCVWEGLW